jgi:hypothetical protein
MNAAITWHHEAESCAAYQFPPSLCEVMNESAAANAYEELSRDAVLLHLRTELDSALSEAVPLREISVCSY